MPERYNPNYIHHQNSKIVSVIREVVFGLEDGMVSTLGAITGIAVGSADRFTVILAGMVIISVESISMGIGSYISNLSEKEVIKRKLYEEKKEIKDFPHEEKVELRQIYLADGWPKELAIKMAEAAAKDRKLMLLEMAYHELNISPEDTGHPWKGGVAMFFSYVVGGLIPLAAYFLLPLNTAIYISITVTMIALFLLGASTTRYSKGNWLKTGSRIFILGGIALVVGYLIGEFANMVIS